MARRVLVAPCVLPTSASVLATWLGCAGAIHRVTEKNKAGGVRVVPVYELALQLDY